MHSQDPTYRGCDNVTSAVAGTAGAVGVSAVGSAARASAARAEAGTADAVGVSAVDPVVVVVQKKMTLLSVESPLESEPRCFQQGCLLHPPPRSCRPP